MEREPADGLGQSPCDKVYVWDPAKVVFLRNVAEMYVGEGASDQQR